MSVYITRKRDHKGLYIDYTPWERFCKFWGFPQDTIFKITSNSISGAITFAPLVQNDKVQAHFRDGGEFFSKRDKFVILTDFSPVTKSLEDYG